MDKKFWESTLDIFNVGRIKLTYSLFRILKACVGTKNSIFSSSGRLGKIEEEFSGFLFDINNILLEMNNILDNNASNHSRNTYKESIIIFSHKSYFSI